MTDNNWKLTAVEGVKNADGRITFGFPAGITIEEVHAKLERLFFKTPYMDWVVDMENRRAITFIHGWRYAQWKKENGEDSDESDDEEDGCEGCGEVGCGNDCYECGDCGHRVATDDDELEDWDIGKDYTETFCPQCREYDDDLTAMEKKKVVSLDEFARVMGMDDATRRRLEAIAGSGE